MQIKTETKTEYIIHNSELLDAVEEWLNKNFAALGTFPSLKDAVITWNGATPRQWFIKVDTTNIKDK